MKNLSTWVVMAAVVVGLAAVAAASGERTLTGSIMCAKCTLKADDATECQNVLAVKEDGSDTTEYYYVVKNAVSQQFGHVCTGDKPAVVTGEVEEKDGKMWITPSKMQEKK